MWSYTAPNKVNFYSMFISGAQRLANGNTLICSGTRGLIFEVNPANELISRYTAGFRGRNYVFRVYRYAPDYPGVVGKELQHDGATRIR